MTSRKLKITLISASNYNVARLSADTFPFVTFRLGYQTLRLMSFFFEIILFSSTTKKGINPSWNEGFLLFDISFLF
jgi:hypothetical protein